MRVGQPTTIAGTKGGTDISRKDGLTSFPKEGKQREREFSISTRIRESKARNFAARDKRVERQVAAIAASRPLKPPGAK